MGKEDKHIFLFAMLTILVAGVAAHSIPEASITGMQGTMIPSPTWPPQGGYGLNNDPATEQQIAGEMLRALLALEDYCPSLTDLEFITETGIMSTEELCVFLEQIPKRNCKYSSGFMGIQLFNLLYCPNSPGIIFPPPPPPYPPEPPTMQTMIGGFFEVPPGFPTFEGPTIPPPEPPVGPGTGPIILQPEPFVYDPDPSKGEPIIDPRSLW